MNLKEFATKHKLKPRLDSCGDLVIPGKPRNAARQEDRGHIFDGFEDGRLALCLMLPTKKRWNARKATALGAGFTLHQEGDTEGCLLFSPEDKAQAKLAISLAGIRTRKPASPAQLAALAKAQQNRFEASL